VSGTAGEVHYKKVVVADNLALIADSVFGAHRSHPGLDTILGTLAFTFQIYCDFSGYTDIARGLSRLMGFELMLNFRLPYFARNPTDFWRRWHISLSAWLKDYVYIPLGGNRGNRWLTYRNLFATMLLGGLWHGAAWNFVLWGAYHGALLIVYRMVGVRSDVAAQTPSWTTLPKIALMFTLTAAGWLIFRATSVEQIAYMLSHLSLEPSLQSRAWASTLLFFVTPLIIAELWQERRGDLLILVKTPIWFRGPALGALLAMIVLFGAGRSMQFIYFQF
jgi:D-alanyl-lipoteichoic acid acyltransferase DltB (MBOAT superfamily)